MQQQQGGKKSTRQQQQEKFGALANDDNDDSDDDDDDDEDDDDDDVDDKETEEFLSEVDDLFALEPEEFERKMQTYDKRQANARRDFDDDDDDDDDSLEDADEADEIEIDRATERISKKKLLKVLDDLQPGGGKNTASMTPPSPYFYHLSGRTVWIFVTYLWYNLLANV